MGGGFGEDQESFPDFVTRQQQSLLRLAFLLAGDRGHAEDLVQTALMTTYRHWDRPDRDPRSRERRSGTGHPASPRAVTRWAAGAVPWPVPGRRRPPAGQRVDARRPGPAPLRERWSSGTPPSREDPAAAARRRGWRPAGAPTSASGPTAWPACPAPPAPSRPRRATGRCGAPVEEHVPDDVEVVGQREILVDDLDAERGGGTSCPAACVTASTVLRRCRTVIQAADPRGVRRAWPRGYRRVT